MKTYTLEYQDLFLATVQIDATKAAPAIKQMVDFWSGALDRLQDNDGDYTKAWLKQLGMFILRHRRRPQMTGYQDEGWSRLDGTDGIKILAWEAWQPDEDDLTIQENSN